MKFEKDESLKDKALNRYAQYAAAGALAIGLTGDTPQEMSRPVV